MHETIFFNRQFISAAKASLPALATAALYGKGVFTTVAIKEKKAFLWEKHWRRLLDNAGRVGVDLSAFSVDLLSDALNALIEKNGVETGRARITFFDAGAGPLWDFGAKEKTSLLIATAGPKKPPARFRLTLSPFPVNSASPLAGIKSCNYLEPLLALDEARRRGFDEAVRLNERGRIASACLANIFWRARGKLFTPPLTAGCLAGTTREFVLENETVEETEAELEALQTADEIFLTSAGLGVCRVSEFVTK
jgi:branched-chain amino acid aminotransferase